MCTACVPLYALLASTTIAPSSASRLKSPFGACPLVCFSKSSQNLLVTPLQPSIALPPPLPLPALPPEAEPPPGMPALLEVPAELVGPPPLAPPAPLPEPGGITLVAPAVGEPALEPPIPDEAPGSSAVQARGASSKTATEPGIRNK